MRAARTEAAGKEADLLGQEIDFPRQLKRGRGVLQSV